MRQSTLAVMYAFWALVILLLLGGMARVALATEPEAQHCLPPLISYIIGKSGHWAELQLRAWPSSVNRSIEPERVSPLHVAVLLADKDAAQLLIHYGADVNAEDWKGRAPLAYAATSGADLLSEIEPLFRRPLCREAFRAFHAVSVREPPVKETCERGFVRKSEL